MKVKLRVSHIVLFFFLLFLAPKFILAQNEPKTPYYFSADFRTGENEPHREDVENLTYPYRGIDLKLGWQTLGKQPWQVAYRYPSFGVGINWATFNTDVLGTPYALFFFTNFPQITTKWIDLELNVDFGISHGIHPYDSITNRNNKATSAAFNAYFGLYLEQLIHLNKHIDAFISEGFTHYSNGGLSYKNIGLNIPSLKFGIRYQPHFHDKLNKGLKPELTKNWSLVMAVYTGTRKWNSPSLDYREVLISQTIYYRPGYKRRVGLGLEMAYNESIRIVDGRENEKGKQLLTYSVFAAHEFLIKRFTIVTQFGIYLYNMPSDKFYYERIGMAYYLTPSTRIVLNLKAHYFKAEYVETGLVFDLKLK